MKKFSLVVLLFLLVASAVPGYTFFDYLFGGSATRDSIDNSAVGDLRSWWTGNPVYQFNPYYSGQTDPVTGQSTQGAAGQQYNTGAPNLGAPGGAQSPAPMQQPSVSYSPPAQAQQIYGGGGQGRPQPQAQPVMQYQQPAEQYQQQAPPPQSYQYQQAPVQQYQQAPAQQYQQAPVQQYQQAPAQQYQQPAPQGYSPQGYAPQGGGQYYQGPPQQYQ